MCHRLLDHFGRRVLGLGDFVLMEKRTRRQLQIHANTILPRVFKGRGLEP